MSIGSRLIYQHGGFFEGPELLVELEGQSAEIGFAADCGELFPSYGYTRLLERAALVGSDAFIDKLMVHFAWINQTFSAGAATRVARLTDVYVYHNTIYRLRGATAMTIYETSRLIDRPYSMPVLVDSSLLRATAVQMHPVKPTMYLGSAGFFNYGHWLVDDLCRADAAAIVAQASGSDEVEFAIPGHTPELNAVKTRSIEQAAHDGLQRSVCFVPVDAVLHYDELFYASPVSYHPALKSPHVSARLRRIGEQVGGTGAGMGGPRIYVTRDKRHGRSITNDEAIGAVFARFGFVTVTVEGLSFAQQVALFREAAVVAGCMGAAMTSTVFCAAGTRVLYLSPEGWMEPFYWDLAATCQQHYFALYGTSALPEEKPHIAAFTINPVQLAAMLSRIVGWA